MPEYVSRDLMGRYTSLISGQTERQQRNRDVAAARRGDVDAIMPGVFPRNWPRPVVANIIDVTARRTFTEVTPNERFKALEDQLQLDRWTYQPGLPENAVHVQSPTLARIDAQLAAVKAGGPVSAVDPKGWATQQWLRFLNGLPRQQTPARLKELDETLGLSRSTNAYVRSAWAELAIANRYDPALPSVRAFVASIGRGLLIRPIYEGLMAQGEWGKPIAKRFFEEARPTYHPVTAAQIAKIVGAN